MKYLTGLIALIKTNLANMEVGDGDNPDRAKAINTYYSNTLQHILFKRDSGSNIPYDQIEL